MEKRAISKPVRSPQLVVSSLLFPRSRLFGAHHSHPESPPKVIGHSHHISTGTSIRLTFHTRVILTHSESSRLIRAESIDSPGDSPHRGTGGDNCLGQYGMVTGIVDPTTLCHITAILPGSCFMQITSRIHHCVRQYTPDSLTGLPGQTRGSSAGRSSCLSQVSIQSGTTVRRQLTSSNGANGSKQYTKAWLNTGV